MSTIFHKKFPGISLTKRGRFWHYYANPSGQRLRGSTKCEDENAAWDFVRLRVSPLLTAVSVQEVATRMHRAVAAADPLPIDMVWEEWIKARRISATQEASHHQAWNRFCTFLKGKSVKYLHQTTTLHCEAFMSTLDKLSGRTLQTYHQSMRRIYRDLKVRAGMAENPWEALPIPTRDTESVEALSEDTLRLIGKQATGTVRDLFVLGVYTGLRQSDIVRLRWAPAKQSEMVVDLQSGFIFGRMSKTGVPVDVPILPPLKSFLQKKPQEAGELVCPELAAMYAKNRNSTSKMFNRFLETQLKGDIQVTTCFLSLRLPTR